MPDAHGSANGRVRVIEEQSRDGSGGLAVHSGQSVLVDASRERLGKVTTRFGDPASITAGTQRRIPS